MKKLLAAIRKSNEDNAQLMYITYTDINGQLKAGFENVIAGLADDVHELAENNN